MRLCNIKLSGFKSFVEPTNLIIPTNLLGIVGPNGCGKSNIIDAVTWVMGESSAKQLRGENLTDVIFNGSSTRQPVGQASVELIFDNTEKKIGGQYASYNEISVKRQITRDGISTYYLNGTRCRRRDITAIFLGTGLGPRSYAIIEQGMISHLIEAKPEELRIFIEEAAGISKYRERRRDTENRIRHTKENIERLNDIRDELEKQLNHLQRQAGAAERYTKLKQKERKFNEELLALTLRDLNSEITALREESERRQNQVEASMATIREIEAYIEKRREELSEANQHFNNMQSDYYKVGSDISQYEQRLQHIREKITAIELEIEKNHKAYEQTQYQHDTDKTEFEKLLNELNDLEPRLHGSHNESNSAYEALNEAEEAMQLWQTEWDGFNESFSKFTREEQISKMRFEHLEFGLGDLLERRDQLQKEIDKYQTTTLETKVKQLKLSLNQEEAKQIALSKAYEQIQIKVKHYRDQVRLYSLQLDESRHDYQSLKGRLVSFETLQASVLNRNQDFNDWLKQNNLDQNKRLSQLIKVDSKWMHALETVISTHLHHICVDDIQSFFNQLENVSSKFGLINLTMTAPYESEKDWPRLIDKVTTDVRVPFILNTIYIANDLNQAIKMLPELPEGNSIITVSGIWISHNWVIVNHSSAAVDTVLIREEEISNIKKELNDTQSKIELIENKLKQAEQALEQTEKDLSESQIALNNQQQRIADIRANLASGQTESEQQALRYQELLEERDNNYEQESEDRVELQAVKKILSQFNDDKTRWIQQRDKLLTVKNKYRDTLNDARHCWQNKHEESHRIALKLESYRSRHTAYENAIKRNEIQLQHLQNRIAELKQQFSENKMPLTDIQDKIETLLEKKLNVEQNLIDARTQVQSIESNIRETEQRRHKQEHNLGELRTTSEQARINVNSSQVRLETVQKQLAAYAKTADQILAGLDENANYKDWNEQLERIAKKIQRLGPINLTAIDEYNQKTERKTYLDSQHKDLTKALTTLENAIRKIDGETRTRFRETFDELNKNIKDMFPKLFGGGHAYLELTGDDLLQTGVTTMARPPGKKNSNIHLLSGGEKALAAVVMIFAIFKLNPAPFCILDEVDAPLDDSNVGRFSDLVKSMSDDVQFIVVTHNKITMEIAYQLIGVTMHEPGVSRLVSVDVDEAVEMAAIA